LTFGIVVLSVQAIILLRWFQWWFDSRGWHELGISSMMCSMLIDYLLLGAWKGY